MRDALYFWYMLACVLVAGGTFLIYNQSSARAQSPFDCDPIYEDAERADTPAERQALSQLYIACMVRENWR